MWDQGPFFVKAESQWLFTQDGLGWKYVTFLWLLLGRISAFERDRFEKVDIFVIKY